MGRSNLRAKADVGGYTLVEVNGDRMIFSERVFVRTMHDRIVAVASGPAEPQTVWELDAKFGVDIHSARLIETEGVLFYGTKNGLLLTIDGRTGALRWQHRWARASSTPSPRSTRMKSSSPTPMARSRSSSVLRRGLVLLDRPLELVARQLDLESNVSGGCGLHDDAP